jgi:hypothetical protein
MRQVKSCRAYRRYQPHRGVMSIAKIKKQNQLQRSAMMKKEFVTVAERFGWIFERVKAEG